MSKPMKEFNKLIADSDNIYRGKGDKSIIWLVRELSVLELLALKTAREALV